MGPRMFLLLLATGISLGTSSCAELRGRRRIQEGTAAYRRGDFADAAERFGQAAALVPEMPLVWLNRGYACRELIVPGAAAAMNRAAGSCALDAFKQLRSLAPADPRGDRLYVQTLFDLGEHRTIERIFNLRHEKNPNDLDVVLVLEQVTFKLGRWRDALQFYRKAALLRPHDAEAQFALGAFIWQVLQTHGGGPAFVQYDPRPRPERAARAPSPSPSPSPPPTPPTSPPQPPPPAFGPDDVVGAERLALADDGIRALGRALELRPRYPEALTTIGLLYRQQSFALFSEPSAWERAVSQAVAFASRAAEKP